MGTSKRVRGFARKVMAAVLVVVLAVPLFATTTMANSEQHNVWHYEAESGSFRIEIPNFIGMTDEFLVPGIEHWGSNTEFTAALPVFIIEEGIGRHVINATAFPLNTTYIANNVDSNEPLRDVWIGGGDNPIWEPAPYVNIGLRVGLRRYRFPLGFGNDLSAFEMVERSSSGAAGGGWSFGIEHEERFILSTLILTHEMAFDYLRTGTFRDEFLTLDDNGMVSVVNYIEIPGLRELLLNAFGDVPTATTTPNLNTASTWAHDGINAAFAHGLIPQNLQSQYNQPTTRAEFAAFAVALYEAVTGRVITERATFNDTTDINVQKMGGLGVVTGVGGGNFAPNNTISRQEAAVMLARLANAIGQPLPTVPATFADNAQVSAWAVEAVGQVQAAGIMGGVGNNNFAPSGQYTREQSIITMLRLFELLN